MFFRLSITNKLRQEQEEEAKIYGNNLEQKQKLQRIQQYKSHMEQRYREMQQADRANQDPEQLLRSLRDEVQRQRDAADSRDMEIMKKEKELKQISKLLSSEAMSNEEVAELEHEVHNLSRHVDQLQSQRDAQNASTDGKIGFFRDRATAVETKKQSLLNKLEELQEERREAEEELKTLKQEMKALTVDGQKPKTDKEMKAYMNELANKTNKYKALKAELEYERQEVQTLMRTEEILRSRDANIEEFNAELEKSKGVVGFQSTQDNLEAVSSMKGSLDNSKGETLESISEIVERITQTLKDKKNKLAPQIKELRAVRHKFEEIESQYNGKKKIYDNMALGYEGDRMKLEQDVQSNQHSVQEEESSYHFLNCLSVLADVKAKQIEDEKLFVAGKGKLSSEYKSYKDMYERSITEQENLAKNLRNEKKSVTENHESHVAQRVVFTSMRTILQKKLDICRQQRLQGRGGGNNMMGNQMGMGSGYGGYQGERADIASFDDY